jgi:hypothetical protein
MRIRGVSEMVRLAGTSLIAGVLIGADKTDESVGVTVMPDGDRIGVVEESSNSGARNFFSVGEGPGERSPGG